MLRRVPRVRVDKRRQHYWVGSRVRKNPVSPISKEELRAKILKENKDYIESEIDKDYFKEITLGNEKEYQDLVQRDRDRILDELVQTYINREGLEFTESDKGDKLPVRHYDIKGSIKKIKEEAKLFEKQGIAVPDEILKRIGELPGGKGKVFSKDAKGEIERLKAKIKDFEFKDRMRRRNLFLRELEKREAKAKARKAYEELRKDYKAIKAHEGYVKKGREEYQQKDIIKDTIAGISPSKIQKAIDQLPGIRLGDSPVLDLNVEEGKVFRKRIAQAKALEKKD